MFLIFENGGKQYKAKKGDVLKLESFHCKKDDIVKLEKIILFSTEKNEIILGYPFIKGAYVKVKILDIVKDEKVIIFKKKRRHNYRRKIGHRQNVILVRVEELSLSPKKSTSVTSNQQKEQINKPKTRSKD
ncbi:MAG: 50S ribosomal protein L21 [Rickettsiales bacterium]|nr:50S ribosomal protein L21 [Rickettsiales bacterium]